jgi:uncharacterized protein (TIGR02452 family)
VPGKVRARHEAVESSQKPELSLSRLVVQPCLDSPNLAAACRAALDVPHNRAINLGRSAVAAARDGHYRTDDGREVDWSEAVRIAREAKRSIPPDAPLPKRSEPRLSETHVTVANETTLGAARRLTDAGLRPLALNFANGVEPGGGFLRGARAQEEVLCRSSALHATLEDDEMYEAHRSRRDEESSDWAILSRDVPVFRMDDGTTLDTPWPLSIVTCAAPYAPQVGQPRSGDLLRGRIARILDIARAYDYDTLVLGAWGCGAFGNDPLRTAQDFRAALEGEFRGAFREAIFAITDWSPERRYLGPFRDAFVAGSG